MEKSRAIELLEHLAWDRDIDRNPYGDALNMAIEALKTQLSQEGTTSDQHVATDTNVGDTISRKAAIDALDFEIVHMTAYCDGKNEGNPLAQYNKGLEDGKKAIEALPSAQPESCEYYALCRHGRDDNKLRVRLGFCEYCNEDVDGFVTPLEKNGHAFVRFKWVAWKRKNQVLPDVRKRSLCEMRVGHE